MKRILALTAAASIVAGCAGMHRSDKNPYDNPFYAKYFTTNSASDQQVRSLMAALQQNPDSAQLHNDLGQVLVARGFPKDAAREFERAIDVDKHYYPAWYNLGLVRASIDDDRGAYRAFRATIHYKPGHAPALFQMGLMEERRGNDGEAIDYYAKAFSHNRALLDIHVNPRVVDSKLVHLALLKLYPREHDRLSMQFHPSSNYMARPDASSQEGPAAPSTQPAAQDIVTPSAPTTDPSQQRSTPNAPAPVPATPPVPAIPAPTNSASVAPKAGVVKSTSGTASANGQLPPPPAYDPNNQTVPSGRGGRGIQAPPLPPTPSPSTST